MAKIKMIGIIKEDEIKKYQKYNKVDKMIEISSDKDNIQLKALPICIILAILCNMVLFFKTGSSSITIRPLLILIGLIVGFLLMIIHEILHGIVYPKDVVVSIGFIKPITFVALASYPMSKKRFILMCLLPIILGIIPMILFILLKSSALCSLLIGMTYPGMISVYPDIYNAYKVARKVPKGKKVLFYEDLLVYTK